MTANGVTLGDGRAAVGAVRPAGGQLRRLGLAGVAKPVARSRSFTARALADWFGPLEPVEPFGPEASAPTGQEVVLLVAELVANALMHAGGALELALHARPGTLRIEVSDGSPVLPALRLPHLPGTPGGHGLVIVERASCRWGAETHELGKTVWAEVRL
ncbi:ATP-binding protein [Kitasatospora sp. NPDC059088]|uniref:ATP-binding protein n=1 Tax=Kitasatospora sp. NPDC059088 TaxID=3346722 RepID=UPI003673D8B4